MVKHFRNFFFISFDFYAIQNIRYTKPGEEHTILIFCSMNQKTLNKNVKAWSYCFVHRMGFEFSLNNTVTYSSLYLFIYNNTKSSFVYVI